MKNSFRQSMAWLHTWAGLVVGWVLYLVFLTGTAGYFHAEITRWMQPERPVVGGTVDVGDLVAAVQSNMQRVVPPGALEWGMYFPGREGPEARVWWYAPSKDPEGEPESHGATFDVASGRLRDRDEERGRRTAGGSELYRLHYGLHYVSGLTGELVVGLCSMVMLVAILTGIVTHKKIFVDFFTFRPAKGQRSWLDAHNLISVTALPFFLMITLSGLVFLMYEYVPAGMKVVYGFNREWDVDGYVNPINPRANSRFDPAYRTQEDVRPSGIAAPLTDLRTLVAIARRQWGDELHFMQVLCPGDIRSRVRIARRGSELVSEQGDQLRFSGATGAALPSEARVRSTAWRVQDSLVGMHEGLFAGWTLRWLYFLSGLLGSAMVATGLIMWTVKRRRKQAAAFGFRVVDALNVGTIAGLPAGIAGYFWANRLIPAEMAGRANWEMHCLFITWGAMLLWAACRPSAKAWVEELWIAAAAFGLLPVLNALTANWNLAVTIAAGDWGRAGFDLTVLVLGGLFAVAAITVGRSQPASVVVVRTTPVEVPR